LRASRRCSHARSAQRHGPRRCKGRLWQRWDPPCSVGRGGCGRVCNRIGLSLIAFPRDVASGARTASACGARQFWILAWRCSRAQLPDVRTGAGARPRASTERPLHIAAAVVTMATVCAHICVAAFGRGACREWVRLVCGCAHLPPLCCCTLCDRYRRHAYSSGDFLYMKTYLMPWEN
jgi:hypothetical protein